eukprot:TRINITY_DN670_c0_g1_i2.p1 TRINITY_DN670_c0_g1~~TRINITY_DN670_c0_g1_i2.p1  ORF type:complete len:653 (-),score=97.63 TRINITY_DN670_c0_g1_i2:3-1961(-)
MINVDSRTFEIGVMRMIGSQRNGIIMMLLTQAFLYAIPAWVFGLGFAQSAAMGIKASVSSLLGIEDISPILTWDGILLGCFLGLLTPVAASIVPIRAALGKNLQDSLDTRQSKTQAVKVSISRADSSSAISWDTVAIGFCLSLFGASIYYGLPLALLTMNLGLLLNIFFVILVAMLLGMVLLCLNLQRFVETGLIKIFFFWENRALRSVLSKNLVAHRDRNQKTSIMYALSLGFIIFVSIAASLQIETIQYAKQQSHGAYMEVRSYSSYSLEDGSVVSLRSVAKQLESIAKNDPHIEKWTWISETLHRTIPKVTGTFATHTGYLFSRSGVDVYAISPGFFDTTIQGFLKVESSNYPDEDVARSLYEDVGYGGALVSSLWKDKLGLELEQEFLLGINVKTQSTKNGMEATSIDAYEESYFCHLRALGFLDAAPAFKYSPFPLIEHQTVLVSFPTFANLTGGYLKSAEDVPLGRFLVKIPADLDKTARDKLQSRLSSAAGGHGWVYNYGHDVEPLEIPTTIITYIFSLTTFIAMFICFFSLMSSMFTNVYEQTKEIGVLRALGVKTNQMHRVYVYEAFVLVMASSCLGILIGMAIGYAMTMQQSLFTQLPIPFIFPWVIMVTVFVGSILFAVVASWAPVHHVMSMQIVQIFRYV